MARLETAGTLQSYTGGNTVGYSAYMSNDIFINGKPLKDGDFIFYSTAPFARKWLRIYQVGYGLTGVDPIDDDRHMQKNINVTYNSVARFIPMVTPSYSGGMPFADEITYKQDGNDISTRKFTDLYSAYMYGGAASKGSYVDRIAFATAWNYKQWVIVPFLAGVYVGCNVSSGNTVFHANVIALGDYFDLSDPTDYPQTHNNGTLVGFSLGFYFAGNLANNTQGVTNAPPQMRDCGFECFFDTFDAICGGYAQNLLPPLPAYANDVFVVEQFPDGIMFNRAANTLLGLGIVMGSPYANSYPNYSSLGSPMFPVRNVTGSGSHYNQGRAVAFQAVGNSEYISFTNDEYQIGLSSGATAEPLTFQIPYINPLYMSYDFLSRVAAQTGFPIIDHRADAEAFMNAPNAETYWNENGDKIKIPNFNPETGQIEPDVPTEYGSLPENDPRRRVTEGTNPIADVAEMDTSDPDENEYTDETPLNSPDITAVGKFNKYYALSADDLDDLADFLYTNNSSVISDILDGLKLNGENPMNFLISLKMFPFDLTEYATVQSGTIKFGNGVNTEILAYEVKDFTATIHLGECTFRKYFKNFYDYEPYTNAKLYIPYCGEVTIKTSQCVGHTISVDLIVDIVTGACCGVVFCDKIAIAYSEGNISVEIPITGENATQYVSNAMNVGQKILGSAGSLTSGNITAGLGLIEGVYDFTNPPTPLETNGSQTPTINFFKPQKCYFVVESPVLLPTDAYPSQVGYACEITSKLSDMSGFIVCANVNNITPTNATTQEMEQIKSLLETGVYV